MSELDATHSFTDIPVDVRHDRHDETEGQNQCRRVRWTPTRQVHVRAQPEASTPVADRSMRILTSTRDKGLAWLVIWIWITLTCRGLPKSQCRSSLADTVNCIHVSWRGRLSLPQRADSNAGVSNCCGAASQQTQLALPSNLRRLHELQPASYGSAPGLPPRLRTGSIEGTDLSQDLSAG